MSGFLLILFLPVGHAPLSRPFQWASLPVKRLSQVILTGPRRRSFKSGIVECVFKNLATHYPLVPYLRTNGMPLSTQHLLRQNSTPHDYQVPRTSFLHIYDPITKEVRLEQRPTLCFCKLPFMAACETVYLVLIYAVRAKIRQAIYGLRDLH